MIILFALSSFYSCATYYQANREFNWNFEQGNLEKAKNALEKKKKAANGKARFLYFANLGVVYSLLGDFETGNEYLEKAYLFGEDYQKNYFNEALSYAYNPTALVYPGEDHEHLMVLYYKALNYLQMKDYEKALVECRRLNIRLQRLSDKYTSENKYRRDAFVHTLMGLIYEADKDYNNAFIAYRNAYEIYKDDYARLFNLEAPQQLKEDLIRTAYLTGFRDEVDFYEKEFNMEFAPRKDRGGSLVFIWNNGLGPVKSEWGINFALSRGEGGLVTFVNDEYGLSFPFYMDNLDDDEKDGLASIEIIRAAFPKYVERPPLFRQASLETNGREYRLELAQDVNQIAFKTLNERMVLEFGKSLLRLAVKKGAEHLARKEDEDFGALVGLFNAFTERADTRNWQSIPYEIRYARIPLSEGEHKVNFTARPDNENREFTFSIKKGDITFHSFSTLETASYGPHAY